jgi:hypothetical protein
MTTEKKDSKSKMNLTWKPESVSPFAELEFYLTDDGESFHINPKKLCAFLKQGGATNEQIKTLFAPVNHHAMVGIMRMWYQIRNEETGETNEDFVRMLAEHDFSDGFGRYGKAPVN